jgi:polysaccharide pyruvyl transferase WcaK-like protein
MLNTLYRLVVSVWPGAGVDVAPFRDEDLDIDPRMSVLRRRIGLNQYAEIPRALERLIRTERGSRAFESVRTRLSGAWRAELRRFVSRYDFVINAPQGPSIGDLYRLTNDILRVLAAARDVGTRYGLAGVSMGPFGDPTEGEDFASDILRGAEGIILREDISLAHVRQRFPGLRNVQSAIDIVFSGPPPSRTDILPQIEPHHGLLEWLDGETIGACISLTPARNPENPFRPEEYVASFSALLDHVLEVTKRRVLLFCHIERDLPFLRRIVESSARPGRVRIFPPELDSSVCRGAMGQLGFFVSSRYHPTVFAVESRTPFLCIKNQFKVEGMLAKLGLERVPSCWQDDDPAAQRLAFDESWAQRDETRARLGPAADRAAALGQVYLQQLRRWARAQPADALP